MSKQVTHVTIHIIDPEQKKIMAMNDTERIAHMNAEAERQSKPQAWSSANQNLNPFPKWVREFIASTVKVKPKFDPLNRLYYVQVEGDMADSYDWMESFGEKLTVLCDTDDEKKKWCTDNCLRCSITDSDEAASMADLEGFLRGAPSDYHRPDKSEKDAQDEGADEEISPDAGTDLESGE